MRRVSREVAQLLERRVETGEGFVENAGQPAEFVVGILYRKSCVQGFRSDLARGCWPWAPKGCLKPLTAPDQRTKASDSCFFWTAQCSNPAKQLNVDRCGPSFEGLSRSRRRLAPL